VRKELLAGGFALSALLAAASPAAAPTIVGKDAPDFVLKSMDGRNLRLSEFRGQVVLVNFGRVGRAIHGRKCRRSIESTPRITRAGLIVLGVSVDEDSRRAREFAGAMKVGYPILFDTSSSIGRDYLLQKMPMTILVDRSGVVRYANVGFKRGDDGAYLDQIRELLRE